MQRFALVLILLIAVLEAGVSARSVLQIATPSTEATLAAESSDGCTVVINEVVHKPEDNGDVKGVDFVELYNSCDAELDLTGWELLDEDNSSFVMGQDGCTHVIEPESFLVFFRNNPCSFEFGYTGIDRATLKDAEGVEVSVVEWGADDANIGRSWSAIPDGSTSFMDEVRFEVSISPIILIQESVEMLTRRKNIIFDLDGTLIDAQFPAGAKAALVLGARAPVHVCGSQLAFLHVYKRPGLDQFLTWCFENFENIGIWTLSGREWLNEIMENVLNGFPKDKWSLLWTEDRATRISSLQSSHGDDAVMIKGQRVVKDLNKVFRNKMLRNKGFTRQNTLIIEDTPSNCSKNYGNAIYIDTFDILSSKPDQNLFRLMKYLRQTVLPLANVRSLNKMHWIDEIIAGEKAEQETKVKPVKSTKAFWMSDTWNHGLKAITASTIGLTNQLT
eukprot:g1269.t1